MKVFCSGPMRGYKNNNFSAFDAARDMLLAEGFEVVSPADLDRQEFGPEIEFATDIPQEQVDRMMKRDLEELRKCDAIYMMEGWKASVGAKGELREAERCDLLQFFHHDEDVLEQMKRCSKASQSFRVNDRVLVVGAIPGLSNKHVGRYGVVSSVYSYDDNYRYVLLDGDAAPHAIHVNSLDLCESTKASKPDTQPLAVDFSKPLTSEERKRCPVIRGVFDYFPDAMLAVANCSYVGNEQHNKGQDMHWAREKSKDHADCIGRHLMERDELDTDGVLHAAKIAWRAMANLQLTIERKRGQQ